MGINLARYIEKFNFTQEGRASFLRNLAGLAKKAILENKSFDFHPAYFWEDDLSEWTDEDRDRLLSWLYEEAREAALNSTSDYDYSVAPANIDELEEEVVMIHYAAGIWRVLELKDRYRFTVIGHDEKGRPCRHYADGRIEYISSRKKVGG